MNDADRRALMARLDPKGSGRSGPDALLRDPRAFSRHRADVYRDSFHVRSYRATGRLGIGLPVMDSPCTQWNRNRTYDDHAPR